MAPDRAAIGIEPLEQADRLEEVEAIPFAIQQIGDGGVAGRPDAGSRVGGRGLFAHSSA
jgi:hypothetical protein